MRNYFEREKRGREKREEIHLRDPLSKRKKERKEKKKTNQQTQDSYQKPPKHLSFSPPFLGPFLNLLLIQNLLAVDHQP